MAAEGLLIFIGAVVGLIAAVLWLSVPFMLYSIKSSLQEIEETLDDLREIDLEIARRLGPVRPSTSPGAPAGQGSAEPSAPRPSLRSQAEQIRQRLQD